MPVERFRSIEEMNRATVRIAQDSDVERFFRHCARYWALSPRVYPRGVFKFRSIDEAECLSARHLPHA
jgi:hypothetical protein